MGEVMRLALAWLVPTALAGALGYAVRAVGGERERARRDCERQDARDRLLVSVGKVLLTDLHQRYVVSGAGCPVPVKDDAEEVYRAYAALGGNGVGTHLYEEIMAAPVGRRKKEEK